MTLGEKLRKARINKKMTQSQVASGTKMKIQIVEAIEKEDFHKITAHIYGKGFIKLYAEYVGIDPKPLINEYISRFVNQEPSFQDVLKKQKDKKQTTTKKIVNKNMENIQQNEEHNLFSRDEEPQVDTDHTEKSILASINILWINPIIDKFKNKIIELREKFSHVLKTTLIFFYDRLFEYINKIKIPDIHLSELLSNFISLKIGILIIVILFISSISRCVMSRQTSSSQKKGQLEQLRIAIDIPEPYIN